MLNRGARRAPLMGLGVLCGLCGGDKDEGEINRSYLLLWDNEGEEL